MEDPGPVWCVVVAAGSGRRFGGAKQFGLLAGRRVVDRSTAVAAATCDGVVVVVPPDAVGTPEADVPGADSVVAGGATRAASVRAGLSAVSEDATVVLVHDAARPLATEGLFRRVAAAVRGGAAAAVPAVPLVDTIRSVGTGAVVDRELLRAVQTPQGFPAAVLRAAHGSGGEATDDASLVESLGGRVELVEGERTNLKLTGPEDLVVAEAFLHARLGGVDGSGLRVGNGFDVHRFSDDPDRPLVLGGVRFDGEGPGLHGHSDADVVAHAIAESLLGPAGLGDLGSHFPDTDERWRGADSMELLAEVVRRVADAGWRAVNVDCSVVAERPRLAPRRAELEGALSLVVGAPVTVKGRRAEGIGGLGRAEGIACTATSLVERVATGEGTAR